MLTLSKLIISLLIPPGLFVTVSVLSIIFLFTGKIRLGRTLLLAGTALFYLVSIEPVMDGLLFGLENRYRPLGTLDPGAVSAIVVLGGGGVVCSSPEEGGDATLSSDSLKRVMYARTLHELYGLPIIVSGGNVVRNSACEAESSVAGRTLIMLGVEAGKITLEDDSRNTWENAQYIKKLYRPGKVLLVTSSYHMRRGMYCFESNNIRCIPAPTDYKSRKARYSYRSFLPRMTNFRGSHLAMKEWLGLVYYRVRYRGQGDTRIRSRHSAGRGPINDRAHSPKKNRLSTFHLRVLCEQSVHVYERQARYRAGGHEVKLLKTSLRDACLIR